MYTYVHTYTHLYTHPHVFTNIYNMYKYVYLSSHVPTHTCNIGQQRLHLMCSKWSRIYTGSQHILSLSMCNFSWYLLNDTVTVRHVSAAVSNHGLEFGYCFPANASHILKYALKGAPQWPGPKS